MNSSNWWKQCVVYQIYPRSFCDSNGDGIGDLKGIQSKLDHLVDLGIDVVWLSPIYKSPNDDNGYDISDYRDIMAEFGTMQDFDDLLDAMHRRGLKLMMDLVVNHTSDEHPWFAEACKSKDNPYRDYYIWRPPAADGAEPNNWASAFGGSAWQWHEPTGEYYLHLFSKKQPDLNWANPKVREEVYDLMRFWLDKGVDGFRMDVINMIAKVPTLADAPPDGTGSRHVRRWDVIFDHRQLLTYLQEMKREVLDHYDVITVGETPDMTTTRALDIVHADTGSLHMVFHFEHMEVDSEGSKWNPKPLDLRRFKQVLTRWQQELSDGGWNSLYLCNHDQPRSVSRFGHDTTYRVEAAKLLATMLHFMRGTPFIYQGEELGMTNVAFESIEQYRDIETLNMYREAVQARGMEPQRMLDVVHAKSRDNARTPMQWNDSRNAGFSTGNPWIGVHPNHRYINVEQQARDPHSVLGYYRQLIRLRKAHPVIVEGRYAPLFDDHPRLFAFLRTLGSERLLVLLNFSAADEAVHLPEDLQEAKRELLVCNGSCRHPETSAGLLMRPYEARVYRLG